MTDDTQLPSGDESATPLDAQAEALAVATAKADENYAQYVRVLAEFDNFRKRAARELDQARQFAVERFAQELLPAMDGFELSIANGAGADLQSLLEGQGATLRLLQKAFEKAGIHELVPGAGSPFNPEEHEAMVAQPSADLPPNSVVVTIQKGYTLNGRVLRAARVIVSRALDA
jgi:molecular chaperone GrpE